MNLAKLFEVQKVLRDRINYNEPDRFNKLVLALLVELGECANEWRGFKFWSKQQTPKVYGKFKLAEDGETLIPDPESSYTRVLEEYVDGLHFVLELGIELGFESPKIRTNAPKGDAVEWFNSAFYSASKLEKNCHEYLYNNLINDFVGVGLLLGFSTEQIEQAYMEKNKVNHRRQDNGY